MSDSALLTALAFANRGLASFPLWWPVTDNGKTACACGEACGKQAAKHPVASVTRGNRSIFLARHGCLSATTNTGVLKHWFGYLVPEANLGIHCDGLIVVDIDPRDGGDESLRVLERVHGEMPLTWRSLTGGGGEHIFFRCPDGVAVGNVTANQMTDPPLGPGIDIRARGGYVVAVPSRHISGGVYAWSVDHHLADVPIAPAPDWLITKLTSARANNGKAHDPAQWAAWAAATHTVYRD